LPQLGHLLAFFTIIVYKLFLDKTKLLRLLLLKN
jgi:hypothetical protein